ncbi:MAG: hypothetical protein HYV15_00440, partial [Elusimicrobia bacterium]|nr:hypothetical protein [Elusimicrobiota bacterium]
LGRALALDPKDIEALLWRAAALRSQGRPREALKDAEAVLSLRPGHRWALLERFVSLSAAGGGKGLAEALAALGRGPDAAAFRRLGPEAARRAAEDILRRAGGDRAA